MVAIENVDKEAVAAKKRRQRDAEKAAEQSRPTQPDDPLPFKTALEYLRHALKIAHQRDYTVEQNEQRGRYSVFHQQQVLLKRSEIQEVGEDFALFASPNGKIKVSASAIEWQQGSDRKNDKPFTLEDAQLMALQAAQGGMKNIRLTGTPDEQRLLEKAINAQNELLPDNQKMIVDNPTISAFGKKFNLGQKHFREFMSVNSLGVPEYNLARPGDSATPDTAAAEPAVKPPSSPAADGQRSDAQQNAGTASPVEGQPQDSPALDTEPASQKGAAPTTVEPAGVSAAGFVVPAPLADVAEPPSGVTNGAPAGVGSEEPDVSAPRTVSGAEIEAADPAFAVSGSAADGASPAEQYDEEVELSYAETQAHLAEYRALIEPQLNDLRRMGEFKDGEPIDSTQNDNSNVYRVYQSAGSGNGSMTFEILYTLNPEKTDLKIVRMHDTNDPNGLVSAGVYRDPEIAVKSDEGHKLHPKHAEWRQAVAEEFGEIAEHTPTATYIPVVKTKAEVSIDASNSAHEPASAGSPAGTSSEHIALTMPPAEEKALGEPILPKAVISDHEATDKIISEMQRRLENSPDARDPRFLTGEKTLDHSRDVYAVAYNPSGEGRDISLSYIFDNEKPIVIRLFDSVDPQGQKSIYSYRDPKIAIAGDIFHPIAMKSASQEADSANGQQFNGAAQAVAHEAHAPICKPARHEYMGWPQTKTETVRPTVELR